MLFNIPFMGKFLFLCFPAIRETEFGTHNETSFWKYLRLQKRTVFILFLAYSAVLNSRAFIYSDVYLRRAPYNWHIALFRVIASTVAIFVGLLVHRKGNYNYPVLLWCLLACVGLVYKIVAPNYVSEQTLASTGKFFQLQFLCSFQFFPG